MSEQFKPGSRVVLSEVREPALVGGVKLESAGRAARPQYQTPTPATNCSNNAKRKVTHMAQALSVQELSAEVRAAIEKLRELPTVERVGIVTRVG